jgi:hypothetical protein
MASAPAAIAASNASIVFQEPPPTPIRDARRRTAPGTAAVISAA